MKILILMVCFMSSCITNNAQENKFSLDLWDYNSSIAYSVYYHFDNEGMFVVTKGGLIDELPDTLISRFLSDNELNIIYLTLNNLPVDSLKNEYVDPLTEDGDQKRVIYSIHDTIRDIRISNVYQEDISLLINTVNELLDDKYKIKYRK